MFALKADENISVTEDFTRGKIKVNKTAEDGIVSGREFKVQDTTANQLPKLLKPMQKALPNLAD